MKRNLKLIIVDHEDKDYVYLSQPECKVCKATHKIYKPIMFDGSFEAKPFLMKNGYYYVSLNYSNYLYARLLAVALIPNPNGYKYLNYVDGDANNLSLTNIVWAESPVASRSKIKMDKSSLKGLKSNSLEYFNAYNHIVGEDGLNNIERYRKNKINEGCKLLQKKYSPIGKTIWLPKDLADKIILDCKTGKIKDKSVYDKYIEDMKAAPRTNKFPSYSIDHETFLKTLYK